VPAADAIVEATSGGHASVLRTRELSGDVAIEALTAREQEVLAHVAQGMPNKAIAEALGISDQTVKFHVAAIIGKLGASNRTDAVRRAIRRGLVVI
jgi:DNA-binding NarL/FixJ family response regulator